MKDVRPKVHSIRDKNSARLQLNHFSGVRVMNLSCSRHRSVSVKLLVFTWEAGHARIETINGVRTGCDKHIGMQCSQRERQ